MRNFLDGLMLVGVAFVGIVLVVIGIVLYTVLTTANELSAIVRGKR